MNTMPGCISQLPQSRSPPGYFYTSASDWRWIVFAIAMVWLAETFNTALEELCNRVSPQFDTAIGRVKDLAAGAVLIASIAAALIGLLTLAPPLLRAVS